MPIDNMNDVHYIITLIKCLIHSQFIFVVNTFIFKLTLRTFNTFKLFMLLGVNLVK